MSYTMPSIRELQAKLAKLEEGEKKECSHCDASDPDDSGECSYCNGKGYVEEQAAIEESEDEDGVPSRKEIIQSVIEHGPDSEYLYFIEYEDLEKLVDAGKVDDVIFSHWDNAQEEMRSMMHDAHAEFGEANQGGKTEHSGAKKGKGASYGRKAAAKNDSNKARRDADKKSTVEEGVVTSWSDKIYEVPMVGNFYSGRYYVIGIDSIFVLASSPNEAASIAKRNIDAIKEHFMNKRYRVGSRSVPAVKRDNPGPMKVGASQPKESSMTKYSKVLNKSGQFEPVELTPQVKERATKKKTVKEEYGCVSSTTGGYNDSDETVSLTQTKRQGDASVTITANAKNMEELNTMLKLAGIEPPHNTQEIEPEVAVVEPHDHEMEPQHNHDPARQAIVDKLTQSLQQKFNL